MRSYAALARDLRKALRLVVLVTDAWFGHLRYATPLVHADDHKRLTRMALRHLVKSRGIAGDCGLAAHGGDVAAACGMLDLDESDMGKAPGRLRWEHSHMFDPVAGRGADDSSEVNALDEFSDWWRRALMHARIGNHSKAYRFLGYCCHLLQDMAVPAHTYCVSHGLRPRIADNLELVSSAKRFRLREPAGPPYRGSENMHLELFLAMGRESRGMDVEASGGAGELAAVLDKYYSRPRWTSEGWRGRYLGENYYPYHRFLPSSPRIELVDLLTMRNFLMARAAERTAQLLTHFADVTGAGDPG